MFDEVYRSRLKNKQICPNIEVMDSSFCDDTLDATLKILLRSRIKDNEKLVVHTMFDMRSFKNIHEETIKELVEDNETSYLLIGNYDFTKALECCSIDVNINKTLDSYLENRYIKAYVCESIKTTFVWINETFDIVEQWHFFQSAMVQLIPWFFKDEPVTDEEKSFLRSLTFESGEEYIKYVKTYENRDEITQEIMERELSNIEDALKNMAINNTRIKIAGIYNTIQDLEHEIRILYKRNHDLQIKLNGLINSETHSDIFEVFSNFKNVIYDSIEDERIYFAVCGHIRFYDEEILETAMMTAGSWAYDLKPLLEKIFINKEWKLNVYSYFYISLRESDIIPTNMSLHCDPNAPICNLKSTHMPNPHINEFRCIGDNASKVREAMDSGEYMFAMQQVVAATHNLNFADGTVMYRFAEMLYETESCCIETETGEIITPKEAIKRLRGENE